MPVWGWLGSGGGGMGCGYGGWCVWGKGCGCGVCAWGGCGGLWEVVGVHGVMVEGGVCGKV